MTFIMWVAGLGAFVLFPVLILLGVVGVIDFPFDSWRNWVQAVLSVVGWLVMVLCWADARRVQHHERSL